MKIDSGIRTYPHQVQATPIGSAIASLQSPLLYASGLSSLIRKRHGKILCILAAYRIKHVAEHNLPSWLKKPLPIAHLPMENTVHYDLGTDLGILEWNNATLPGPNYDGVVWLTMKGGERKPFTFALFHQLRCLNIIRETLMAHPDQPHTKPNRIAVHCMNYIRQMVLCRADLALESGRHPLGPNTVVSDVTHVCRDWSVIWDEAEGNDSYHRK